MDINSGIESTVNVDTLQNVLTSSESYQVKNNDVAVDVAMTPHLENCSQVAAAQRLQHTTLTAAGAINKRPERDSDCVSDSSKLVRHSSASPTSNNGDHYSNDTSRSDATNRRKKHRRGKHKAGRRHNFKRWKPYNKLTWDEKKELEDRETRRANLRREQRIEAGRPVAPYNTTQFLMEQHQMESAPFVQGEYGANDRQDGNSGQTDSSDDYFDSPDDDLYLEKDFATEYENFHAERLGGMTKDELVRGYIELESKVEYLEEKIKRNNTPTVAELNKELERLRAENSILCTENQRYKTQFTL